jgi:hypothetical protein
VNQPIPSIPVIDVDQAFPTLTSDGGGRPSSQGSGDGTVTPTVEGALRDVLGWRPRSQDTAAFSAALAASFQLSEVEGHVVATYSPRGFAMQADLGGVTGGQASLYSRAVSGRTQMLTLLDGLTALRPDADTENCEAYRGLVREAVTTMINELGTPGGPRVAVVDAFLRQLLGTSPVKASTANLTADTVSGQLGQLRIQFGLVDTFVNSVDQEGVRTAFWTLVDLVLDTNRAWVNLRNQFTGKTQQGFLGTQLVIVNQLLSATAEQVDDTEAALDSVFVSAAERQTITLPGTQGLTLDGLLSWTRTFVTEEGPRIVRDAGRDGIATSFMPTVLDIVAQIAALMKAIGRPTIILPEVFRHIFAMPDTPAYSTQLPLVTVSPRSKLPPGMQAARIQIAVSGLDSLLWQLARLATRIARYSDAILFDAIAVVSQDEQELLLAVRGLNLQPSLIPVFRSGIVHQDDNTLRKEVRPFTGRTSFQDDTISAVFKRDDLRPWLEKYDNLTQGKQLKQFTGNGVRSRFLLARDLPISLRDTLTGKRVRNLQTRP